MWGSIAEGTVTKWMKNVGDRVQRDEPLFEISTDKVDAEIPAPATGVLKEIRVQPGATVPINTVVAVIAAEGEAVAPAPPAARRAPPDATRDRPAAAPASPAPAGAPPVNFVLEPEQAPRADRPRSEMTADELRQTRSSPVVRRIAAEHNLDIREVPGTGIAGRVTKQDILGHIETRAASSAAPTPFPAPMIPPPSRPAAAPAGRSAPPAAPATPAVGSETRGQVVPMSPIRKKTAEHMVLSKRTSAHVATVFEIDMTRVDQLRNQYRPAYEQRSGVRLTYLPFILKATIDALKAFPVLNASIDGDSIVYHKDVNVGLAVALDWGLIVPVIHRADEKNLLGLARAVNDLADRARAKKLRVDEVQGGTFTITNPGVFGSLFGTPIINQPQVAILGVGTIEKRPVV